MDFEIAYDPAPGCMRIRCWGPASVEGGEDFFAALLEHPEWKPGCDILIDQVGVTAREVAASEVRRAAQSFGGLKARLGDGRCAVVMGADLDFGLARMWEQLSADEAGLEVRVFRDLGAAEHWLARE